MRQLQTPVFEVERIDFTMKRLNLEHNPRTQNTIEAEGCFNTFGRALLKLRKSFLKEQLGKRR